MKMTKTCAYCDNSAIYRDRTDGCWLCLSHARLEITGPRGKSPRPPVTIRPVTEMDRPYLIELVNYFWNEMEIECFDRTYQAADIPAYVACDEREIVGVASYARHEDAINLVALHVAPQWQGRGVANSLLGALIDAACREDGVNQIVVATSNDNLLALGFYQRLGFVITNILPGRVVEQHGGVELVGFAGIPVRDEIQLALQL